jgi:hypothetical protein
MLPQGSGEVPWTRLALGPALLLAMPYLMLRLVGDFATRSRTLMLVAGAACGLAMASAVLLPQPYLWPWTLAVIAYFAIAMVYCGGRFARSARCIEGGHASPDAGGSARLRPARTRAALARLALAVPETRSSRAAPPAAQPLAGAGPP